MAAAVLAALAVAVQVLEVLMALAGFVLLLATSDARSVVERQPVVVVEDLRIRERQSSFSSGSPSVGARVTQKVSLRSANGICIVNEVAPAKFIGMPGRQPAGRL